MVKSIMAEKAVVEFGHRHNELIGLLEAFAGGNGPYGDTKVFFDAATTPNALPDSYQQPKVRRVRDLVHELERETDGNTAGEIDQELKDLRLEIFTATDVPALLVEARTAARNITDDVQRLSRVQQIDGLEAAAALLRAQLSPSSVKPTYNAMLTAITGFPQAEIPSQHDLLQLRDSLDQRLLCLGFEQGDFVARMAAFRNQQQHISPADFVGAYDRVAQEFIASIKDTVPGFPATAAVKIVDLHDSPGVAGSFDYGRGGEFQGTSSVRVLSESCWTYLLTVVGHEIGGHFRLSVQWDLYSRETGDPYGSVQTTCSNMTVVNEGVAEQGALFYHDLVTRHVPAEVMAVETEAYYLNRVLLAYQTARQCSDTPLSEKKLVEQCVQYGLARAVAENRARGLTAEGDAREVHAMTYIGPAYFPGMKTVQDMIGRFGKAAILEVVRAPLSIAVLGQALESRK